MVMRSVESKKNDTLKFLCSYGGKILPRSTDGNLRYVGGMTRVFSVDRTVSFSELMVKLSEFCGYSVTLRCQLPDGDLETLITIKSDEDLANLIEEYERAISTAKIRAILSPPASLKQISPPSSVSSGSQPSSPASYGSPLYSSPKPSFRAGHRKLTSPPASSPPKGYTVAGRVCCHPRYVQGNPLSLYYGHHLNYKNY